MAKEVGKKLERSWKGVGKELERSWKNLEKSWKKVGKSWKKVDFFGQVMSPHHSDQM